MHISIIQKKNTQIKKISHTHTHTGTSMDEYMKLCK